MANKSHKTTFFIPMLCRFSLNDTVQPPKLNNNNPPTTDPSSPKLTCIGQIKKKPVRGLDTKIAKPGIHSNRYTKLQKLFSGKNLVSPAIDTCPVNKSVATRSKSCNGRSRVPINKKKCYVSSDDLDLDLDPPLPVVKCRQESNVNLWKRRGIEVKSLEIQPVKLNLNRNNNNNNCNSNGGFENLTAAATF
ncbi:uncharacterized protein LOC143568792 [Bidens hawaiensis]|uniref:uncharacterized protein LOC143568792 n=1 Tax=Bidens hawaiensis TaxID=980011 RepID=UPI0040494D0E